MADRINDITWQARQGSVAAIIQVLNENLVLSGVRTRAVFVNGVLQILCEAATVERLEQCVLVPKIQQILESLTPRNIRRVNINSRIVREEQLLWLEEIHSDSDKQLLWSEEIVLTQPNPFKLLNFYFIKANTSIKTRKPILAQPQSLLKSPDPSLQVSVKTLIVTVSGLSSIILLIGLWDGKLSDRLKGILPISPQSPPIPNQRQPKSSNSSGSQTVSNPSNDPFSASVRLANQATGASKTAMTSTQWLELAATWQRASDLMSQVSPSHRRYQEAQIRMKLYKKFSEAAQKQAEKSQS
ncbi:MAG: hypothetical protein ACKO11_16375 [Cuspidothrix sp.]